MDTLCRLMQPELPLTIDPKRLAQRGELLQGQYLLRDMPRLEALLHDSAGAVVFSLNFSFDEIRRISFIRGSIRSQVKLQCQRCLGDMCLDIDNPVYLGLPEKATEQSELPQGCEPVAAESEAGSVSLHGLIEDELILAIPIAPMHPVEQCRDAGLIESMNQQARTSPFSVLKNLSKKSINRRE